MSSHREAPEISKDPVADNCDVYAFVSPDKPDTVTIITNYVPLEGPPGGPNFFEFGDDVLYSIYVDNNGDALPEIAYQFSFNTLLRNPNTFLYNTGPISSLGSPTWNKRQVFTVSRVDGRNAGVASAASANGAYDAKKRPPRPAPKPKQKVTVLGRNLASPPCNIGPRSTPNYPGLAQAAVRTLASGETVFAGQRREGFFVDLGAIFDLADLRPFQHLHLVPSADAAGVDGTKTLNVHTIAIQIPIRRLTKDGSVPKDPTKALSTLGIWGAASRRKTRMIDAANDERSQAGPWVQVSRLGNPLFNEVVTPLGRKDYWNTTQPAQDKQFQSYVERPELSKLLPVLYPGVFPNLAGLKAARADLVAILMTGIPSGIVPGFQNFTGKTPADMLRLNVAIPPSSSPSPYGLLGNDPAGFPNGRRVTDDVVSIELRAFAGATYALVNKGYTPDAAASKLTEGLSPDPARYLSSFPYLGVPLDGYDTPSS